MDLKEKNDYPESSKGLPVKDRFPRIVIIIVIAEFCERFSYSGMRAFLTLYLRSKLGYTDDGATEIYHIFSTLVYLFPTFGGILADNYLGKYRTILYMLFVYAAGNVLVAITAIPQVALPARCKDWVRVTGKEELIYVQVEKLHSLKYVRGKDFDNTHFNKKKTRLKKLCTLLGLFMITVGTGGIKPCVTAFGGDQFVLPAQERHLAIYFSVLYFTLCTGSLIAKAVSPILRSEVSCFGDKDCYSLAFGAPGLIIIISIVVFVSAKRRYRIKRPEGNVVFDFLKCVSLGLKNVLLKRTKEKSHWLDSTEQQYDKQFIQDVKKTLSILALFTVLPVFFALLDQLGSRWTLQATKMDGRFGLVTVKPDQMQVLVPTFILVLIPISQKFVYPYVESRGVLRNPLHKLTLGGLLAGVAFIASGMVEIYLKTTYPELPRPGYSQLRIFNGNSCSVSLHCDSQNVTYTIPPLSHFCKKDIQVTGEKNITFDLGGSCIEPTKEKFLLEDNLAVSFFLNGNRLRRYRDSVDKSRSGFPVVRFLISESLFGSNITMYNEKRNEIEVSPDVGVSLPYEVYSSTYSIRINGTIVNNEVEIESGGVYAIILEKTGKEYASNVIVVTEANSITMALLLPQFLIMATAEVLFAVTGNEFAFKESPDSMKAVMTAVWLVTDAMGNILIIVVTRLCADYNQETQFFIYTALVFISMGIFSYMCRGYQFSGFFIEDHRKEIHDPKERRDSKVLYKERRSNIEVLYHQVKQVEECLDH